MTTLGIFDSGEGGFNLLRHARLRNNRDDVIFLCDRANAPYGTKRSFELSGIVEENIRKLKLMGAERVIIACCTACTVFDSLSDKSEVYPILSLAASEAERICSESVAVIATGATVRSGEFGRRIKGKRVKEIEAQPLVSMIDGGACDENADPELKKYLRTLLRAASGCDTLVLGCTHFSSVKETLLSLGNEYGIRHVVDAAEVGAQLVDAALTDGECGKDYIFKTKKRS